MPLETTKDGRKEKILMAVICDHYSEFNTVDVLMESITVPFTELA
jgi:hypothetical protein